MHLFFYARGINQQVEIWKILAQSQFWKWKRKRIDSGEEDYSLVQGALRPSVLGTWEYIFPEECLAEVIAILGVGEDRGLKISFLRKMIGAKKIPKKIWKEALNIETDVFVAGTNRGLRSLKINGVAIHIIGIKKDRREVKKEWGYEQEML